VTVVVEPALTAVGVLAGTEVEASGGIAVGVMAATPAEDAALAGAQV